MQVQMALLLPSLFTGKERDTESGNDYFEARYYSSNMGRFMSPDPIGIMTQKLFDPQQWNDYAYSKNNPLRFMDPSGMYVTTCKDGDKACAKNASDFEKSRQRDLKSKDAAVRGAAGAYGDPGKANGRVAHPSFWSSIDAQLRVPHPSLFSVKGGLA
jgi:RHS repeat-associated protein